MALLYTNENFPQPVVEELRKLGNDVLTTHDAGHSNAGVSDSDVVKYATAMGRVVVTLNRRDFIKIHRSDGKHAGIVVCTVDRDYVALAARIDQALSCRQSITNELVSVVRGNPATEAISETPAASPAPMAAKAGSRE